jgi:hypothetical protein
MPRFGTVPGCTDLRRVAYAAFGTVALVAAVTLIASASAFASTPAGPSVFGGSSWPALPQSMSDELTGAAGGEGSEEGAEPAVCSGCTPPLTYHGGVVMGTTAQAGAITITPIYWVPGGFTMAPVYKSLINQYIADVAHDSGTPGNVFAINAEYSRATTAAGGDQMKYQITAGTPITDTTGYPGGGCTPDAGYTACVTEAQLETRLSALLQANALPVDLAHIYPVFFPLGVDFANSSGKHKDASFCAYHGAYVSAVPAGPVIFAVEPFSDPAGCGEEGQFPNWGLTGDLDTVPADGAINVLSHEIDEAITDPQLSFSYAWYDSSGNEIGDECAETHGPVLGSTDTSSQQQRQQTGYNQVINGHKYYTQLSFSDATFAKFGMGQGCVGKAFQPQGAAEPTEPVPDLVTGHIVASPNTLPANGTATSTVTLTLTRNNGAPVVGDNVNFDVATAPGESGLCGEVSDSGGSALTDGAMSDDNGEVTVTYTASTEDATCDVIATDFESGTPTVAIISQGTQALERPFITASIPTALTAGAAPVSFDATAQNPGDDDVENARVTVYLFGDNTATAGLTAAEVHLTYADDSTGGQPVGVALSGTTVGDGVISGFVEPEEGTTLPGEDSRTTTFGVSLAAGAPSSAATGSKLFIETDLDQIDPADGSATNLEYTDPAEVTVNPAPAAVAPPPPPPVALPPAPPPVPPTTIKITVPGAVKGCKVPKLVGQSYVKAKATIKKAGCPRVTVTKPSRKTPKGKRLAVTKASPKAGTALPGTGTLSITVGFRTK